MLNIVLLEPQIPQNTGSIIRLCANAKINLHLVKPYGFDLNEKSLRRAGLDYHEFVQIKEYANFLMLQESLSLANSYLITTKATKFYTCEKFKKNATLVFGNETKGASLEVHKLLENNRLKIPMQENSRSINLANSVAIVAFEALRQLDFANLG